MGFDEYWIDYASPAEVEAVFIDAMTGEKDEIEILAAAYNGTAEERYTPKHLIALERAVVLLVGKIGQDNRDLQVMLRDIEDLFAMNDPDEIRAKSVLGASISCMEELIKEYERDGAELERLYWKLQRMISFVDWILIAADKLPGSLEEGLRYYKERKYTARNLAKQLVSARVLLAEEPNLPKVQPETLQRLHNDSILDLYALFKEEKKNNRSLGQLRAASILESRWSEGANIDLGDKWLLFNADVKKHKHQLKGKRFAFDAKKRTGQEVEVPNALLSAVAQLEQQVHSLADEAERVRAPGNKPSRFWRAFAALLLCVVMIYMGWNHSESIAGAFESGFRMVYALGGYAFIVGLVCSGFLYGVLFFFLSCIAAAYLIFGGMLDGRIPLDVGITAMIVSSIGVCVPFLLWRMWKSRKGLTYGSKRGRQIEAELQKVADRAELGVGCTNLLYEQAKAQDMPEVALRYRKLNGSFYDVRAKAENQQKIQ